MARTLALALLAAFSLVLVPSAASADVYPCRRAGGQYRSQCAKVTDVKGSLPLRLGAGYGNTRPGTAYRNGDELALQCWTTGPADEYGNGDTYWFEVFDPNDGDIVGYVNDYNLTTGQPSDWKPHFSHCDDPVSQPGKPYQCDRQGGEYRAWCAKATYVAEDMWLPLDKRADYAHGAVGGTKYHNGDPLALACWTTGPGDFGGHGDKYWFNVYDPADHAIEGYVNDYSLTTGSPSDWKKVVAKCDGDQPPGQNPPSYPHSVKVLQWNIAGSAKNYGGNQPVGHLVDEAQDTGAQIISLNEVCEGQALHAAHEMGMHYVFVGTDSNTFWCRLNHPTHPGVGSALLSTAKLTDRQVSYFTKKAGEVAITSTPQERGVICATAHLAAPVRACSAHLAKPQDKLNGKPLALEQANKFAQVNRDKFAAHPTVISGDFNAWPTRFSKKNTPAFHGGTFYDAGQLRGGGYNSRSYWTYHDPGGDGPYQRLDYIFGNKAHFKKPTASSSKIIGWGRCWQNPLIDFACSDHRLFFGTMKYHS